MTETPSKGGAVPTTNEAEPVFCEVVGSGNWTVQVWRTHLACNRAEYRLMLSRDGSEKARQSSCVFTAADVLDLPGLVQVLCATLVNDGWLRQELKDDLACLADTLDCLLGSNEGQKREGQVLQN